MSKRQFLCILGVWVMIFLFVGFPSTSYRAIAVVSGLIIVIVSYTLPTPASTHSQKETFTENNEPRA